MFQFKTLACGVIAASSLVASADTGWVQWKSADGGNDHWYYGHNAGQAVTWADAQANSILAGGTLATITSAEENAFVYNLIKDPVYWWGITSGPWLGAYAPEPRDNAADGWQWVTGEAWGYTNWGPDLGNTSGMEDRLQFQGEPVPGGYTQSPRWNDYSGLISPGNQVWSYVIESNVEPVPEPMSLMVLGLAVLGTRLGKKRR